MERHATMPGRAVRRLPAVIATVLAAQLVAPGATADGRDRGFGRWEAVVGVDALALIDWWEERVRREGLRDSRSTARFRADSRSLLLHCGPGGALAVAVAPLGPDGQADRARRSGFRCAPDEALYGDAEGRLLCAAFAGRIGPAPPGPVEILVGVGEPRAVVGVCLGGNGEVTTAYVPEVLANRGGACPTDKSSVSFRGSRRTGACAR